MHTLKQILAERKLEKNAFVSRNRNDPSMNTVVDYLIFSSQLDKYLDFYRFNYVTDFGLPHAN